MKEHHDFKGVGEGRHAQGELAGQLAPTECAKKREVGNLPGKRQVVTRYQGYGFSRVPMGTVVFPNLQPSHK